MDLEKLYEDKELTPTNRKSFLKFVSALQTFGSIIELYTVKAVETGFKLLETVFKK